MTRHDDDIIIMMIIMMMHVDKHHVLQQLYSVSVDFQHFDRRQFFLN